MRKVGAMMVSGSPDALLVARFVLFSHVSRRMRLDRGRTRWLGRRDKDFRNVALVELVEIGIEIGKLCIGGRRTRENRSPG